MCKSWIHLKEHFIEANNVRLMSGLGTAGTQGYHGSANTMAYDNNDSIELIKASANATQMNENMESMATKVERLEAAFLAS